MFENVLFSQIQCMKRGAYKRGIIKEWPKEEREFQTFFLQNQNLLGYLVSELRCV